MKPATRHAFTFGLVLPAILVTSCPAETILMYGASQGSGPSFGVAAGEAGGAIAAGSALGLGLAYVAILAAGGQRDLFELPVLPAYTQIGGMTVGFSAGSALGTWLVGRMARQDHREYGAFLGALAGLPVSFGLVVAAAALENNGKPGALLLIPAFAAPPAGAVIGYNLSPPCGCWPTSRHDSRLLIPGVGLRKEHSGEVASVALDVRLLNVRF
jgi:hypothetical protein